jgi:hypothetical protein
MRFAYIAIFPVCIASFAISVQAEDSNKDKPEYSTGRTQTPVPETKGQKQPQGWTGPIETGTGGAPPSSPQGQSPPGMEAAPEGSSKTTVAPDK